MTNKCQSGRNTFSGQKPAEVDERCPLPPLPDKSYCAAHQAEAQARVARWIEVHGEPKPRPWRASYVVSGSSRE